MDNFDKLFQDKLGEITENDFEFKASSWERFHGQWNEENVVSKRVVPLVWIKRNATAAAVILLLLMSNVFFAQQFLGTRTDVKKLTSTIEELRGDIVSCQEKSETYTKAVADLETKMEQQSAIMTAQSALINTQNQRFEQQSRASFVPTFPVQNGIVTTNDFNSNGNNNNNNGINNLTSTVNSNGGNIPNQINTPTTSDGIVNNPPTNNSTIENNSTKEQPNITTTNNGTIVNNSTTNTTENEVNNTVKSITELNKLQLELANKSNDVVIKKRPIPEVENDYEASFGTKLNMFAEDAKPSAYQVGVSSMFTFVPTVNNLPQMTMTNNGVIANALFFNNFRLQIGTNYWGQFLKIEDIETLADGTVTPIIDEFPLVEPVNYLDELHKIETKTYGFDIPINAQLMLRPNAKLNPYVGFGVVGRYFNNYQLEYYFLDNATSYEYELKGNGQPKLFNVGIWQSQIGMDYSVFDNWLINLEVNYLKSFQEQGFGLSNIQQYGASLGVKYEF